MIRVVLSTSVAQRGKSGVASYLFGLLDGLALPPFKLLRTDAVAKASGAKAVHVAAAGSKPFAPAD